jgi:DNA-binding protein YbaB
MMDSAQWLADYNDQLARTAAGARAASASLGQVGGRATSPRGEVTVTVNAAGALEDIAMTPAARRLEVEQLARLIVDTARQAHRAASAQMSEILHEYLGQGPALDLVIGHLPTEVGR